MKIINIGMADWRVSDDANHGLCIMGLGSCLAIGLYDPTSHIAGMVHTMLPRVVRSDEQPVKYVTTALPFLIEQMVEAGAEREMLRSAVCGGATMLSQGQSLLLEIGQRNIAAVEEAMKAVDITPAVWEVGGTKGRTVTLAVATGEITVAVLGQPDVVYEELCAGPEVQR